jgi:hypothetical protein
MPFATRCGPLARRPGLRLAQPPRNLIRCGHDETVVCRGERPRVIEVRQFGLGAIGEGMPGHDSPLPLEFERYVSNNARDETDPAVCG